MKEISSVWNVYQGQDEVLSYVHVLIPTERAMYIAQNVPSKPKL